MKKYFSLTILVFNSCMGCALQRDMECSKLEMCLNKLVEEDPSPTHNTGRVHCSHPSKAPASQPTYCLASKA